MEPFRLLNLPQVVLGRVFQSGLNIVHLALCSSKSHQIVKDIRLKVNSIEVIQKKKQQAITLRLRKTYFYWQWKFEKDTESGEEKVGCEKITIGEHTLWIKMGVYDYFDKSDTVLTANVEEAMERIQKLMEGLIKAPTTYILSTDGVQNFKDYYVRNVNRKDCKSVSIYGRSMNSLQRNYIPKEIMILVLDNTPSHCELRICSEPEDDFKYEKNLHFKSLQVDTRWLTVENLLNTRCESIQLCMHDMLTVTDLKELVTRWTNGEYPELRFMSLRFNIFQRRNWYDGPEAKRILYDGLDVTIWQCDRMMRVYDHTIHPEIEMADFQREDGVRATIGVGENTFIFVCGVKNIENSPVFSSRGSRFYRFLY